MTLATSVLSSVPSLKVAEALKGEADEGVSRGPGDRPTSGLIRRTSETGFQVLLQQPSVHACSCRRSPSRLEVRR